MHTFKEYLKLVDDAIAALKLPAEPAGLYRPIEYTLEGGGKRLRPVLALAAAEACGSHPGDTLNQALAIEVFHNFTLLHDDVMDRADMRRGRPTVHHKWDDNTAILSGDAMLTLATSLLADGAGNLLGKILALFNHTAMQIYEGQQYDIDYENRNDVTVDQYMSMIYLKTSVLLGCACRMGGIMAGASEHVLDALYDYGANLGMAFQLRDDYLDTFGDPDVFGKKIGGDILNDKKTWLRISAMSDPETSDWDGDGHDNNAKIKAVTDIYLRHGLDRECMDLVAQYASKAIVALTRAGFDNNAINFFVNLTDSLTTRSK